MRQAEKHGFAEQTWENHLKNVVERLRMSIETWTIWTHRVVDSRRLRQQRCSTRIGSLIDPYLVICLNHFESTNHNKHSATTHSYGHAWSSLMGRLQAGPAILVLWCFYLKGTIVQTFIAWCFLNDCGGCENNNNMSRCCQSKHHWVLLILVLAMIGPRW